MGVEGYRGDIQIMNDDIEQIREWFPKRTRDWGTTRPHMDFILGSEDEKETLKTVADLFNQSYREELGYTITAGHIISRMIISHELTRDIYQEIKEQGEASEGRSDKRTR